MIYNNIYELIGNTPIINISKLFDEDMANIYLKLEWFNPGGSIKDRIAIKMIEEAEKAGILKKGDTIIESTSGNTGIGIAMIAAAKGYKTVLVMPDFVSEERIKILKGYGAEVILLDSEIDIIESFRITSEIAEKNGYFEPMQFENINNSIAHMETTAVEILKDLPNITHFVAAVGTGGTLTGVGTVLKEHNSDIKVYAVEPENSAVLQGCSPGIHKIQGIGTGYIPNVLDTNIYDDILLIDDDSALETARLLAKKLGIFGGMSTGANVYAAYKLAQTLPKDSVVLTISPSNGERYLTTELYKD